MYVELGIWLGCAYILNEFRNRDINHVRGGLQKIFHDTRSEGVRNKNDETFSIGKVYRKDYGFLVTAHIPYGCSSEAIIKLEKVIEDNLSCICKINKKKFENYVTIQIVNVPLNIREFEPYKTRSNELFLGYQYDGKPYIIDLNKDPHLLLAGKTGSGKSFLLASMITNHIYFNSDKIEIYLLQKMKGEINIFRDCPSVKFCSNNENEIMIMLEKLSKKINERSILFAENGIKNISQWNKHYPKRRMKRIIIVSEEISFFMSDEGKAFEYFNGLVKAGRSVGIHFIGLTQRTTTANLGGNGELKSQMTVVTGRQRDEADSRNAIGIGDASTLEELEFISSCNDGYIIFKSCYIDEDFRVLNKYVPEIKIPQKQVKKEILKSNNNPNMCIIDCSKLKEREHEEWCRAREIKIIEIDLSKQRKERQEELTREYNSKVTEIKPTNTTNNKKGKVSLKEVASDVDGK